MEWWLKWKAYTGYDKIDVDSLQTTPGSGDMSVTT